MSQPGRSHLRLLDFWPGLNAAWRGSLIGLAVALGFAALLELALISSLVWPLWIGRSVRAVVWLFVAAYWILGAGRLLLARRRSPRGSTESSGPVGLFCRAQTEYLKGNWFGAERLLQEILRLDAGDADARMLLASLYRHVNRFSDARRQLSFVGDAACGAQKWGPELRREQDLLAARENALREPTDKQQNGTRVSGAA